MSEGDEEPEADEDLAERLNSLLDRPFFDPSSVGRDEPQFLSLFREFWNRDPQSAETLYVGLVLSFIFFLHSKVCESIGIAILLQINFAHLTWSGIRFRFLRPRVYYFL